jgi:hypothetical protein
MNAETFVMRLTANLQRVLFGGPEPERRGCFRTKYEGPTPRENLAAH